MDVTLLLQMLQQTLGSNKGVVEESIKLLNLSYNRKLKFKKQEKMEFQKRVLTGKVERKSVEEKGIIRQDYEIKRSKKVIFYIFKIF